MFRPAPRRVELALVATSLFVTTTCTTQQKEVTPSPRGSTELVKKHMVLAAVGDVHFGRYDVMTEEYVPVSTAPEPFVETRAELSGADVTFANLETPVAEEPPGFRPRSRPTFRGNPVAARQLAAAGFDVVSIANNHILDLGTDGVSATRGHLTETGIAPVGAGASPNEALRPVVVSRSGVRIAFIALTEWSNIEPAAQDSCCIALLSREELLTRAPVLVSQAIRATGADFFVASVHWGAENERHPESEIRHIARALIDAGATVVLGHHPHWVQDMERYRNGFIAYSLGNFLFDTPSIESRLTVVLVLGLQKVAEQVSIDRVTLHPVMIEGGTHVPRLLRGARAQLWASTLRELAPSAEILTEPALELTTGIRPVSEGSARHERTVPALRR